MSDFALDEKVVEKINLDLILESEKQKDRITELENQIKNLQSSVSKDSIDQIDHTELKNQNATLHRENKSLKAELKEDKSQLQKKINDLQEQLQKKDEKLDAIQEQYESETFNNNKETNSEIDEEIELKNREIEKLENELVELDKKYDTLVINLRKKIENLHQEIERLEKKNEKLSNRNFSRLEPKSLPHSTNSSSTDMALINKMKEILNSWPGGIKLRNLAMSMGISVTATNEFLEILEKENYVNIDRENVVNSNPVIYPK